VLDVQWLVAPWLASVLASRLMDDGVLLLVVVVVEVIRIVVATLQSRLHHAHSLEPENSSNDQFHAHDNYNLILQAAEHIRGRPHHPPDSLHIHNHPRRNPHMRLDRSKNFVAQDAAASTKNFVFDSHWQQSHSIRWSYISERMSLVENIPKHLQLKWMCVVYVVVVVVVVSSVAPVLVAQWSVVRSIHVGHQMEIQPGME